MSKVRYLAAIIGLVLFLPTSLFSQSPRELRLGTSISGSLSEGEEQWFSLQAPAAGYVIVETSGSTDTYLEAYDASNNLIDENDDGGEDTNARLDIFVEEGRTYLFKLRGYDEDTSGSYRIWASFDPVPPETEWNTERSSAASLKLWEQIPVYFRASSQSRWYRYDLFRPENLLLVHTKGSLDTVLCLYDVHGELIEEDDDSGEDQNASLSVRVGPGTVYIEVKAYGSGMGRCTLEAAVWYRD
jgi:serine protease Do